MANGGPLNEYGLTPRQELFVRKYVESGGAGTESAKQAGYAPTGAHVRASELLAMPKVQARLETLSRDLMASYAPGCIRALHQLAVNAQSETVRQAAATSLLDRTGYKVPLILEINDNRTQADVDRELSILLGLDPASLSEPQEADKAEGDALATVTH